MHMTIKLWFWPDYLPNVPNISNLPMAQRISNLICFQLANQNWNSNDNIVLRIFLKHCYAATMNFSLEFQILKSNLAKASQSYKIISREKVITNMCKEGKEPRR